MDTKKKNQVSFRMDDALFREIEAVAKEADRTPADFTRLCVEACMRMLRDPSERTVPQVIQDVIDRRERKRLPLGKRAA